jgi:hypothetical protein
MGTQHQKKRAFEPVSPFAPPLPEEVDQREGLPMAVALDEGHTSESSSPTTQSPDAFDRDVARRNRDPNFEKVG